MFDLKSIIPNPNISFINASQGVTLVNSGTTYNSTTIIRIPKGSGFLINGIAFMVSDLYGDYEVNFTVFSGANNLPYFGRYNGHAGDENEPIPCSIICNPLNDIWFSAIKHWQNECRAWVYVQGFYFSWDEYQKLKNGDKK